MTRDQALQKIKKCLALAKSQNPHEAAAAMRQALKLMVEHNLDEQGVSLTDVSESKASTASQANVVWVHTLFGMVADAFGCKGYVEVGERRLSTGNWAQHRRAVFVGVGAAAEVASYAYEVLYRQCVKARLEHVRQQPKNCKPITKTARGDQFALGWAYGVRAMLDRFANSDRNQQLLENYMATKHPNLKTVESKNRAVGRNVRNDDLHKGVRAGERAQLQRGVGGVAPQGMLL